jgi:hypothetical protein
MFGAMDGESNGFALTGQIGPLASFLPMPLNAFFWVNAISWNQFCMLLSSAARKRVDFRK